MNELNDMTCAELADVAAELALGVLTGRERAVAIGHLNTCEACREDVRQLMATGEQLRELLPPAEPPAGFETRVLERLGLPAPAGHHDGNGEPGANDARPLGPPGPKSGPRHRRASGDTARPGARQPGAPPAGPGAPPAGPGTPPAGPGGASRPGRMRRALAAVAVSLAVIVAGLGGWRIGAAPAASPLKSASLVSASSQHVGQVFYYSRDPEWLYMSVDMGTGNGLVTCQVIDAQGRVATVGSFKLADGYGSWGSPDPGTIGELTGARLVSANGTVLATGTFTDT
jgi:hypothetical protein